MSNKSLYLGVCRGIVLALLLGPGSAAAAGLAEVMGVMEADLERLTAAVLRRDLSAAEAAAGALANHPTPGLSERLRLLARIGGAVSEFRRYDTALVAAAEELVRAARAGRPEAVAVAYRLLVDQCLGCHGRFQPRFRGERP